MRSFTVPWIPHDDVITPQDIQGVRGFGVADAADPLATVMERKITRMRAKHAQTREYMEINALRGVVKDGAGVALYDYFDEFGLAQQSVDFVLGTAGTNVQAKCREVLRDIETELKGETMAGVLALVSPGFFDKLIGHGKVEEAYKYFSSTGAQPLREDTRRRFPFAGIVFEEYNATVTLSTGATETLIPANEGIAFPLGTMDTFVTYGAPANLIETVNTMGLPIYARQIARQDGSAIDVKTEASPLPINKRPRLAVKIHHQQLSLLPVPIDFDALVLGPVYETFGELAVLTMGSGSYDVAVLDHTKGVSVEDGNIVGVQTIRPAVDVRRTSLDVHRHQDSTTWSGGQIVFGVHDLAHQNLIENGQELRLIVMQDE